MSDESFFGEVIATYTRAQALEDGVLIDVTGLAREAGIVCPVALTRGAWDACVVVPKRALAVGQDETGRLWDVLWRFAVHSRNWQQAVAVAFNVSVVGEDLSTKRVSVRAVCSPGDEGEPVVTIMLPDES